MEQQFLEVTEMAPRLELLEGGHAQMFLLLYDSYVPSGATVAMASCLEKDDLLELLEETDDEVLIELPVGVAPKLVINAVGGALVAEEKPEGGEGFRPRQLTGIRL